MKTVDDVVQVTRELLKTEKGKAQSARVIAYLMALRKVSEELSSARSLIRQREGAVFFATVGNLRQRPLTLDVRIEGHLVATVRLQSRDARLVRPEKRYARAWPKEGLEWADGRVLQFLRELQPGPDAKVTEALVQAALFLAMAERSSAAKVEALLRHQPVRMLGMPFQFPLPVSASGSRPFVSRASALGHADIVARLGSGQRIGVFEIKKPRGKARYALRQAAVYAATLASMLEMDRATMLWALGFKGEPRRLPIEACAFVDVSGRSDVLRDAEELNKANVHHPLKVMIYRMSARTPEIVERIDI